MIRLLHVDDCSFDRVLTRKHIEQLTTDIEIAESESGEDALKRIETHEVDCVLCDFQMPGMDGLELLNILRRSGSKTPFIFLTGQGNEKVAAQAFREGANDYYTKDEGFAHYDRLVNSIRSNFEAFHQRRRRKAAEAEIKRERDKARMYLDIAGVILIALDNEGKISLINKKGGELLGLPQDQLIGMSWFDNFILPEEREEVRRVFNQIIGGELEPAKYFENNIQSADGGKRLIAWHNTNIRDDSSNIIGTLSSGEDITERRAAEEALRASEGKYKSLVENLPDTVMEIDASGRIKYINRVDDSLALERVIGAEAMDFIAPGSLKTYKETLNRVLRAGLETTCQLEDTLSRSFLCRVLPRKDKSGKVIGAVAIAADITGRRSAEAALRLSEMKYRTYISLAPEAVFILGPNGKFIEVNEAACGMTGYTEAELLSMSPPDLMAPEGLAEGLQHVDRLIKKGNSGGELVLKRRDGSRFHGFVSAAKLSEDTFIGFCVDVTQRRRAEEELRKTCSSLELRRKELETANREIGAFAYSVSHDLHAPLRRIISYTDLLLTEDFEASSKEARGWVEGISRDAHRMRSLIDEILSRP